MLKVLGQIGKYALLMRRTFTKPQQWRVFFSDYINEMHKLGVGSIWIVVLISFFIGAVMVVQIKLNIDNPIMPRWVVGYASREIIMLEFSSSIMFLILAGKVGSNIASEIGTMRITEQIDALEIMGVNSANYLILPKTAGLITFTPVLVIFSMALAIVGGYAVCVFGDLMSISDLEYGLQIFFRPSYVWYTVFKSMVFAYIVSTIAGFFGYYAHGGSLDVGKASTNSVVMSSVLILLADLLITNLVMG